MIYHSLDSKEGLTKTNKVRAYVHPSVYGRVKGTSSIERSNCQMFETAVRGNSKWGARIEGPIIHRSPLVGGEPMEIEIARKGLSGGYETW
jgi:hypothetical protein